MQRNTKQRIVKMRQKKCSNFFTNKNNRKK